MWVKGMAEPSPRGRLAGAPAVAPAPIRPRPQACGGTELCTEVGTFWRRHPALHGTAAGLRKLQLLPPARPSPPRRPADTATAWGWGGGHPADTATAWGWRGGHPGWWDRTNPPPCSSCTQLLYAPPCGSDTTLWIKHAIGLAVLRSSSGRRREFCHSAALPSTCGRCFYGDAEGVPAKGQSPKRTSSTR